MPIPSQPLSAKKTRAAVAAQGSALNNQGKALKAVIEHLDDHAGRLQAHDQGLSDIEARLPGSGLLARLRWLLTGK
jgi:hypothetical protein